LYRRLREHPALRFQIGSGEADFGWWSPVGIFDDESASHLPWDEHRASPSAPSRRCSADWRSGGRPIR